MGIEIFIWNHFVGALVRSPHGVAFEYDKSFKTKGLELSPLNLPLNGKAVYFNEPDWQATQGIPGFIYDALPDKFGTDLLLTYFNEKGLTERDIDVFAKLQYIGSRAMGALEFKPATETEQSKESISLEEIEKLSLISTEGKRALNTNVKNKKALLQILHIGTSAGGARAKALVAIHKQNGTIKSGQINHGDEYDSYLLKIDGANQSKLLEPSGYGKLEYTYYQMALDCGIDMSKSALYENTHFVTKRFDRSENGEKLHMHSLCGLMGLDYHAVGQYSYEHYFMAARRLGLGQDSLEEIYRRMVFNVLTHNCDDHTKNFAFLMDKRGQWTLSPAYDVCYSYNGSNEWVNGHNMRVNHKRTDITKEDLLLVGEKFNLKRRKKIIAHSQEVINEFQSYAAKNDVSQELIHEVEQNRPTL